MWTAWVVIRQIPIRGWPRYTGGDRPGKLILQRGWIGASNHSTWRTIRRGSKNRKATKKRAGRVSKSGFDPPRSPIPIKTNTFTVGIFIQRKVPIGVYYPTWTHRETQLVSLHR